MIHSIPLPERGRRLKTEGNGLYIIISPKGMRKWQLAFRWKKEQKWIDLGKYPAVSIEEARKRAREKQYLVDRGINPLEVIAEEESKLTVGQLADEYIDKWAKPRKRSWKEDERILRVDVLPYWKDRNAEDIKKGDVVELLQRVYDRGAPIASNNTLRLIRKMYNFAVERDLLEYSPINGVKQLAKNRSRDRVLSDDEIREFWFGLDKSDMYDKLKIALKLLLLTAQRPGEVAKMQRSEIDGHWWTIPGEKAKNGRTHRVYLSSMARELIAQGGNEFVIESPRKGQAVDTLSIAHALKRRGIEYMDVEYFRPHDLRRTAATGIAKLGFPNEVIGRVLNHTFQGVTAVYNRYQYDDQVQEALEAWADLLENEILAEQTHMGESDKC
jgi:integrase